ncbi:MAG TPA: two-component regulator propeller domain-containing protein [Candidatus Sulfotelmatobacter sp.]|nr:two-component regulator propeller domain-containing protein [Candidatus Sulfotelmatobacter sp.]
MRIARCGLFFLASIALIIAVPATLFAATSESSNVRLSVVEGKDIRFAHLSRREGLSQGIVEHILQDDQGFLWFGTQDGLTRFDGYTFNIYKRGAPGSNNLSGVEVTALLKDRAGALWIGVDQFLDRLDPVSNSITRYRSDPNDPSSLGGRVYCITQDEGGSLWLGTSNGLDKLDPITGKFSHYHHDPENPKSLSANGGKNKVESIIKDQTGRLWVQTSAGLDRFDPRTGEATHYPELRAGSEYEHLQVYQDRSGTLWILSSDGNGLASFEPETRKLTRYTLRLAEPGLSDPERSAVNRVNAILEDKDGVFWLGTGGNGLIKFDLRHGKLTRYRNDPEDRESLSNNWVLCLFEDLEGNIWAGTGGGGLNRFPRSPVPFTVYRNDARSSNRLNQNFVLSVYQDSRDILWVGNDSVLNAIDEKTGRVKLYRHDPADRGSISDATVLSAIEDPSGTLWFGTYRGGLNRFDPGSGKFKAYRHRSSDPNSISSDVIFRLFVDHTGRLWIETDQGLDRFDPNTGGFKNYFRGFGKSSVFRIMAEDQQGMLWLGTYDDGAYRFDPDNGQFRVYKYAPSTPGSLSSNHVNAIYVDTSGTVWIGTQMGLNKFDGNGSFITYFRTDGLPDDDIRGILQDLQDRVGNLWISTNNGLSKFNLTGKTFRNYHVEDGLAGNEFNFWGAPFRSTRGELFFPGVDGLTAFFPGKVTDNSYVPPVILTDFRLFNETVPTGGHSPLKKAISYTDALELSHKQSVVSFEFSALSYVVPEANRYRYKLEGLETRWNDVSSAHRYATYTTLPPGDYVFRVQGSNNRGVWNENGVSVRIRIRAPWWSTWWFSAIVIASFLFLLWCVYYLRVRNVKRRHAEILALNEQMIKGQEAERMRISGELHDGVLQQITSLSLRLGTAKRQVPPDSQAKATLSGLQQELIQIGTDVRHLSHELHPALLHEAGLPTALSSYCEEFSKVRGLPVSCQTDETVKELSPGSALCLYRIAQEALGNAAKHSRANKVEVQLTRSDSRVCLSVSDDGVGCAPGQIGKSGGLGVINMRERVLQLNGTFEFDSEPGRGTAVKVEIPFRPARVGDTHS